MDVSGCYHVTQNVFLIRFPRSDRHEPPRDIDRITQHNIGNNVYIPIYIEQRDSDHLSILLYLKKPSALVNIFM